LNIHTIALVCVLFLLVEDLMDICKYFRPSPQNFLVLRFVILSYQSWEDFFCYRK